ncbi:MAG TPA: hypothetical protein PK771_01160 [Spirochaetota bacterium]|nr:hypothetical protein [Spirochaetota bacterium]
MEIKAKGFVYNSGTVEIKNVVDPIIRLGIFIVLPSSIVCFILGAIFNIIILVYSGIAFLSILIFYFLYKYNYFSKNDPDRLQTEKYQLEKSKMVMEYEAKKQIAVPSDSLITTIPLNQSSVIGSIEEDEKEEVK